MTTARPPQRPGPFEESLAWRLFLALAPRVGANGEQPEPPPPLGAWETVEVARRRGRGVLDGTWYPALDGARGAVLLLPPWTRFGKAYFHRRGRLPALRRAGYHALAVDLPGFGGSGPPAGFYDHDVEDALDALRRLHPEGPYFVWGVSAGGYWAHPVVGRRPDIAAAFFEDVSPHLLEWSWRVAPWGRPFYLLFRALFPRAYRYLDMRHHAPLLQDRPVTYVSGQLDHGVRPEDTRALATPAHAHYHLVPDADHLESIKRGQRKVLEWALGSFREAPALQPKVQSLPSGS